MLAGFDYASGDCAVILDADLQDPVEVVPELLKKWEEGYKDVYGNRMARGNEPWIRKQFTLVYYRILSGVSSGEVLRNVGDFRLLDRCCIDEIRALRETQRYTKGLYSWIGFSKAEVCYDRSDRNAGKSSFSYRKLVNLAIEGITSHTTSPLRFASVMGIAVALASLAFSDLCPCEDIVLRRPGGRISHSDMCHTVPRWNPVAVARHNRRVYRTDFSRDKRTSSIYRSFHQRVPAP